jgi:ankyrin repeat protein
VDEVLAAVKDRKHAGRGPLHMAAWAGRLEMCKFLIKDLRIDANTVGNDGTS